MSGERDISDKWCTAQLEQLLTFVLGGDWGKAPDFSDGDYTEVLCIRASEIKNWEIEKGLSAARRKIKKSSLESRELKEHDIILEVSGGGPEQPVGRTVIIDRATLAKHPEVPKVCTNFFRMLRPSKYLLSGYLNNYLMHFYKSGNIIALQSGSNNLRNLKVPDYLKIEIPIPPLNEQKRIVVKIEELFSELDKGIESLKLAQEQLKVYRQAVLKQAFEGKLTAKWREENKEKLESADDLLERIQGEREGYYQQPLKEWQSAVKTWENHGKLGKKPAKPRAQKIKRSITNQEADKICSLPISWKWVRPEELASPLAYSIGIGPFGSNLKVSDYRDSGIPLVFVKNITRNNFSLNRKYVDEEKFNELRAHTVNPNDILITKMGDPPGDCTIYPPNSKVAVLTADCLKFRIWDYFLERKFYMYCIQSSHVKKQLGLITRGVAQKKISVERFKTLFFPLPSRMEQLEIVSQLDSVLSRVASMESEIKTDLRVCDALRQSILKKAFSGQLVPQDPDDEPASVLLERIRAEKEAKQASSKKTRKKRKVA